MSLTTNDDMTDYDNNSEGDKSHSHAAWDNAQKFMPGMRFLFAVIV